MQKLSMRICRALVFTPSQGKLEMGKETKVLLIRRQAICVRVTCWGGRDASVKRSGVGEN